MDFRQRLKCFRMIVFIGIYHFLAFHSSANDLTNELIAGNQSAIESMRTLSCQMTITSLDGSDRKESANYWKEGDSWRIAFRRGSQITTVVVHDSVRRTLTQTALANGGTDEVIHIAPAKPGQMPPAGFDVLGCGLVLLPGPIGSVSLHDLVHDKTNKVRATERKDYGGHACISVEMSLAISDGISGDWEIWFDPKVNYLARRISGGSNFGSPPKNMRRESEVLNFSEILPGVYFPAEAEAKFYRDGVLTQHERIEYANIRINQPLPKDIFDLPIPPNARVIDVINDRQYKVDKNGKAVGPERSLPKAPPLGIESPNAVPFSQVETTAEPRSRVGWVLLGLVLLLFAASSLWFVRRYREVSAN